MKKKIDWWQLTKDYGIPVLAGIGTMVMGIVTKKESKDQEAKAERLENLLDSVDKKLGGK